MGFEAGDVLCQLVSILLSHIHQDNTMESSPASKASRIKRFGRSMKNHVREARDAILSTSQVSSPRSYSPSTAERSQQPASVSSSAPPGPSNVTSAPSSHHIVGAPPDTSTSNHLPNTADESQRPPGVPSSTFPSSTSEPSSQPAISAPPDNGASGKYKEGFSVAWHGLETVLRVLEKSADAFPPLKSAVGGLVACLDVVQVSHRRFLCFYILNYVTDSRRQSGRLSRPRL